MKIYHWCSSFGEIKGKQNKIKFNTNSRHRTSFTDFIPMGTYSTDSMIRIFYAYFIEFKSVKSSHTYFETWKSTSTLHMRIILILCFNILFRAPAYNRYHWMKKKKIWVSMIQLFRLLNCFSIPVTKIKRKSQQYTENINIIITIYLSR